MRSHRHRMAAGRSPCCRRSSSSAGLQRSAESAVCVCARVCACIHLRQPFAFAAAIASMRRWAVGLMSSFSPSCVLASAAAATSAPSCCRVADERLQSASWWPRANVRRQVEISRGGGVGWRGWGGTGRRGKGDSSVTRRKGRGQQRFRQYVLCMCGPIPLTPAC